MEENDEVIRFTMFMYCTKSYYLITVYKENPPKTFY